MDDEFVKNNSNGLIIRVTNLYNRVTGGMTFGRFHVEAIQCINGRNFAYKI